MPTTSSIRRSRPLLFSGFVFGVMLCFLVPLTGCLVAGYSSGSGVWVWPGSLVVTLVLALLYFLMRHR